MKEGGREYICIQNDLAMLHAIFLTITLGQNVLDKLEAIHQNISQHAEIDLFKPKANVSFQKFCALEIPIFFFFSAATLRTPKIGSCL